MLDRSAASPYPLDAQTRALIQESRSIVAWTFRLRADVQKIVDDSLRVSRESSRLLARL